MKLTALMTLVLLSLIAGCKGSSPAEDPLSEQTGAEKAAGSVSDADRILPAADVARIAGVAGVVAKRDEFASGGMITQEYLASDLAAIQLLISPLADNYAAMRGEYAQTDEPGQSFQDLDDVGEKGFAGTFAITGLSNKELESHQMVVVFVRNDQLVELKSINDHTTSGHLVTIENLIKIAKVADGNLQ